MARDRRSHIAAVLREYVTRPELARTYDDHYRDTDLLRFDTDLLRETLTPPGRVLDIGCGTGRHLIALARDGHSCVGTDLSQPMLDIARAKIAAGREDASSPSPPARLVRADMRAKLPFRPESFDYAICMFSTMGLVPSAAGRRDFLAEVRRVLKPGGVFVLHVHNRLYNIVAGWGRWWLLKTYTWNPLFTDLEIGDKIIDDYRGIKDMYLHVFSLGEVCRLLLSSGFEIRRSLCLNDDRTGEVTGSFASVQANGFIFVAARPRQSGNMSQ